MKRKRKEGENTPKSEGTGRRNRASVKAEETTLLSPVGALQIRKFSDTSNSNLSCNSSQFNSFLEPAQYETVTIYWFRTLQNKRKKLNRAPQALFVKSWVCLKQGLRRQGRGETDKSLPSANYETIGISCLPAPSLLLQVTLLLLPLSIRSGLSAGWDQYSPWQGSWRILTPHPRADSLPGCPFLCSVLGLVTGDAGAEERVHLAVRPLLCSCLCVICLILGGLTQPLRPRPCHCVPLHGRACPRLSDHSRLTAQVDFYYLLTPPQSFIPPNPTPSYWTSAMSGSSPLKVSHASKPPNSYPSHSTCYWGLPLGGLGPTWPTKAHREVHWGLCVFQGLHGKR